MASLQFFRQEEILYDMFHVAEFARLNLDTYIQDLYQNHTELNTIWISSEYAEKNWCGIEIRAIRARFNQGDDEGLMPIRLDDTPIKGLFDSVDGHIHTKHYSPEQIAALIKQRYDLMSREKSQ